MNHFTDLHHFAIMARPGDTYTTVRPDMMRAETYTATGSPGTDGRLRAVILTRTITVGGMLETKETAGLLVLDSTSIPGETLDALLGKSLPMIVKITPLAAPITPDRLTEEHHKALPRP